MREELRSAESIKVGGMPRPKWHTKIVRAIREMHQVHGFKLLEPQVVYLRLQDGRRVTYKPDAILLRKRRGVHAVVIEAESNPAAKVIPGDVVLASLVKSRFAEMFPYEEVGIGRRFRGVRSFRDTYDARKPVQVIDGNDRLLLTGNMIGKLSFLLIVPDRESANYNGRYLELFLRRQWGKRRPFRIAKCISCRAPNVTSTRRSIGRILSGI